MQLIDKHRVKISGQQAACLASCKFCQISVGQFASHTAWNTTKLRSTGDQIEVDGEGRLFSGTLADMETPSLLELPLLSIGAPRLHAYLQHDRYGSACPLLW